LGAKKAFPGRQTPSPGLSLSINPEKYGITFALNDVKASGKLGDQPEHKFEIFYADRN
jgi:hypothetical protein